MAAQPDEALTRLAERIDLLNKEVNELREVHARQVAPTGPNADLSAALGTIKLTLNVQSANIKALLDIVQTLAKDIDRLNSS